MKTYWTAEDVEAIATGLGEAGQRLADRTVLLCGGAGFLGRYLTAVFPRSAHIRFVHHDITRPIDLNEPLDFIIQAAGIASPYY